MKTFYRFEDCAIKGSVQLLVRGTALGLHTDALKWHTVVLYEYKVPGVNRTLTLASLYNTPWIKGKALFPVDTTSYPLQVHTDKWWVVEEEGTLTLCEDNNN
jgi:hypothetical protein